MFWRPTSSSLTPSDVPAIRCIVCNQQAFGMNYGVISCNACKMFFRRVIILQPGYTCRDKNRCYQDIEFAQIRPRCRSCRFARCLAVGMRYWNTEEEGRVVERNQRIGSNSFCTIVRRLLQLDATRALHFETMHTDEDPTIEDLILRTDRRFMLEEKNPTIIKPSIPQVLSEWSFIGIWTSVEFHNSLDFMPLLGTDDKKILIKSFAIKSYLLSSAFRCASQKSETLVNPDGTQLFPACLTEMPQFSESYVNRIQKWLVSRLSTLGVTSEEYILVTVILFCNPALSGLSQHAQHITAEEQRKHGKALFEYSMMTWNDKGPMRFQEIVSLGNVIDKCFEDVQHLVQMLQLFHPNAYNYKKLFMESLNK